MREWIRNNVIYWGDARRSDAFGIALMMTVLPAVIGLIGMLTGEIPFTLFSLMGGITVYVSGAIAIKLLGAHGWSADSEAVRKEWMQGWPYRGRYSDTVNHYVIVDMIHNISLIWPGILLIAAICSPFLMGAALFKALNVGMENTMQRIARPKEQKQLPTSSRSD